MSPPGGDVPGGHACCVPIFYQGILGSSQPPFFLPLLISSRLLALHRVFVSAVGGLVRRGDSGRPGPEGPQPAPLHPAGAEGRPPREERAEGPSLHAAGGAVLLQKVLVC